MGSGGAGRAGEYGEADRPAEGDEVECDEHSALRVCTRAAAAADKLRAARLGAGARECAEDLAKRLEEREPGSLSSAKMSVSTLPVLNPPTHEGRLHVSGWT